MNHQTSWSEQQRISENIVLKVDRIRLTMTNLIKQNNYPQMFAFLKEEKMTNVSLTAEGKIIKAHKLILAAASKYFEVRTIFDSLVTLDLMFWFYRNCLQCWERTSMQSSCWKTFLSNIFCSSSNTFTAVALTCRLKKLMSLKKSPRAWK